MGFTRNLAPGLLTLSERRGRLVLRLTREDGRFENLAVLDDVPHLIGADDTRRYGLVQYGWSPRRGTRPALERLVTAWDLSVLTAMWSARPRFVADEVAIDVNAGTVDLRSGRYGHSTLRLADGFLVKDRGRRWARQPNYPGVLPGAFRPHPAVEGEFGLWPVERSAPPPRR